MNITEINPLALPSLPLPNRSQLPRVRAIYFALDNDRVLYIGRTVNLAIRWLNHHRRNHLVKISHNIRIAWLECNDSVLLPEIEKALIKHFQPILNYQSGTKRDDPDYAQVSGYIPKAKALKFKVVCTAMETTQSDALDEAISLWLEKQESSTGKEQDKKTSAKKGKGAA